MAARDRQAELARLKQQLDDLLGRWPAHSVPPSQWMKREDLEDRIASLEREIEGAG